MSKTATVLSRCDKDLDAAERLSKVEFGSRDIYLAVPCRCAKSFPFQFL